MSIANKFFLHNPFPSRSYLLSLGNAMTQIIIKLIFLLFVPRILIQSHAVQDQHCIASTVIYDPGSTFHQNLQIVLEKLNDASSSSTNFTFNYFSHGQDDDKVYALYLCRGDLSQQNCSVCVHSNSVDIVKNCNHTESIRWAEKCMVRYAKRNIFFKEEESPSYNETGIFTYSSPPHYSYSPPSPPSTDSPTKFTLGTIVDKLINETAFSKHAFATSEDNVTGSRHLLYSLAQCTPDIDQKSCQKCLKKAFKNLMECCDASGEALSYLPSCQLRYDTDKFFEDSDQTPEKEKEQRTTVLIATITVTAVVLIGASICLAIWAWRPKRLSVDDETITVESLQLDFNSIRVATDNFSDEKKLGQGGFGAVYKGNFEDGQEIAVKRLSRTSKQGIQEFKTEVLLVAKLQHKNLVRLLGFCVAGEEKLLVYEFLQNSSLDHYLCAHSDFEHETSLDWKTRYKIIEGIAKGLLYLHEDSRFKIIHRDLKPNNILLDKDMIPKISDFGMAKLFGEDEIQGISNRIVGTRGYMAPEYVRNGQVSFKSDVYSFGVLVLEMVSGQRVKSSFIHSSEYKESLLHYAWRLWKDNQALELMDSTLCGDFSAEEAKRCIHLALSCIQENAERRPTMASIVSVLNSHGNSLPPLPESGISADVWEQHIVSTYSGTENITTFGSGR